MRKHTVLKVNRVTESRKGLTAFYPIIKINISHAYLKQKVVFEYII